MGVLTLGILPPHPFSDPPFQFHFPLTFWGATATLATPSGIGRDARARHTAASWADGTDGTMLAESLSMSVPAASSSVHVWWIFVVLVVGTLGAIPFAAWIVRRGLPVERRVAVRVEPVVFGTSQKTRRSPRHAVLQHRSLVLSIFAAVLVLFLLPGIVALRVLGVPGLQVAISLVVPTLMVALHARQRNATR